MAKLSYSAFSKIQDPWLWNVHRSWYPEHVSSVFVKFIYVIKHMYSSSVWFIGPQGILMGINVPTILEQSCMKMLSLLLNYRAFGSLCCVKKNNVFRLDTVLTFFLLLPHIVFLYFGFDGWIQRFYNNVQLYNRNLGFFLTHITWQSFQMTTVEIVSVST